ncbi:MAG: outer membrane protein assembly factor BamD [Alphaproteobacteria bacterium]|nr:outer membrane protein assembly factor BamD [Alphaproteobacteria bacterium]
MSLPTSRKGRFYLKRGYYDAALRRFERVITDYQTSNQVPEALFRMVEAYLKIGLALVNASLPFQSASVIFVAVASSRSLLDIR